MTRFQPFAWLKEFHVHGIKALGLGLAQTQHFQTDDAESCGMHGRPEFPGEDRVPLRSA